MVDKAHSDCNLLSLSKVDDAGGVVVIKGGKMHVFPPGTNIQVDTQAQFVGVREGGLYAFNGAEICSSTNAVDSRSFVACKVSTSSPYYAQSVHRALAHSCNYQKLVQMASHGSVLGLGPDNVKAFRKAEKQAQVSPCLHCAMGAFPQLPVGRELRAPRNMKAGGYWHVDLLDIRIRSKGGNYYTLLANDDTSSYLIDIHVPNKKVKETIIPALKELLNTIRLLGGDPKLLHFDADTVFEAQAVKAYLRDDEHVIVGYSEPGEHRHSGSIENMARYVQDGMRKLLTAVGADDEFWCYAVHQICYIHNRVITARHKDHKEYKYKTPYEILRGTKPDITKLVPWGVACVSRIPNPRVLGKTLGRGRPGVTLGNAEEYNDATYVYNLRTKRVVVSKDIRVDETRCGFTGKPIDWHDGGEQGDYRPDDREVVQMPVEGDHATNDDDDGADGEDPLDLSVDPIREAPGIEDTTNDDPGSDVESEGAPSIEEDAPQEGHSGVLEDESGFHDSSGAFGIESGDRATDDGALCAEGGSRDNSGALGLESGFRESGAAGTGSGTRNKVRTRSTSDDTGSPTKRRKKRQQQKNVRFQGVSNPSSSESDYGPQYKTKATDRRVKLRPEEPQLSDNQKYLKKKLREAAAIRLGRQAHNMKLRSRALQRQAHKSFLMRLLNDLDENDVDPDSPVARDAFRAFAATSFDPEIPQTYEEAMSPEFRDKFGPAIREEIESIKRNKVFGQAVKLPRGHKP